PQGDTKRRARPFCRRNLKHLSHDLRCAVEFSAAKAQFADGASGRDERLENAGAPVAIHLTEEACLSGFPDRGATRHEDAAFVTRASTSYVNYGLIDFSHHEFGGCQISAKIVVSERSRRRPRAA